MTFTNALAASLIWGINTLFLLDAGLSSSQAFAANAAYTAGMVVFEVPTGVVADTRGRRASFLLGTLTLAAATVAYYAMWAIAAPFGWWLVASAALGLGYTFFSGATEAWLADALAANGHTGGLESVLAKGQTVTGVAMLGGSVAGGLIAQVTSLGVPYLVRALLLVGAFGFAVRLMRDEGFTPVRAESARDQVRALLSRSIRHGLGVPAVRWTMIAGIFTAGVAVFAFYAMQPYLLERYGDADAYWIAGLMAAIVAGSQIAGGLTAGRLAHRLRRRTTLPLAASMLGAVLLIGIGLASSVGLVLVLAVGWGLVGATSDPFRRAYLNAMIPSQERATVLSFDSLLSSAGGVVTQPALGRVADVNGYAASFVVGGAVSALAVPFLWFARRLRMDADVIEGEGRSNLTNCQA